MDKDPFSWNQWIPITGQKIKTHYHIIQLILHNVQPFFLKILLNLPT